VVGFLHKLKKTALGLKIIPVEISKFPTLCPISHRIHKVQVDRDWAIFCSLTFGVISVMCVYAKVL